MIHCALDDERSHRCEEYLARVAGRSDAARQDRVTNWHRLTPRESEILRCLAEDLDLPIIARRLHVSHATVRNHVQHLLQKTEAHSVQEVVARYLLTAC